MSLPKKPFNPKIISIYILSFLLFSGVYLSTKVLLINLPAEEVFRKILVSSFLALPTLIFGKKFIDNSKEVFNLALENKLYEEPKDNKQFISSSESIFNRQSMYNDLKFVCIGVIGGFMFFYLSFLKNYTTNQTWEIIIVTYSLALVSICMFALIFSVIWLNYFLLPISRRFHNAPIIFRLYNLDKSVGINHFKSLLRNLLIYDILMLATLFTATHYFNNVGGLFIGLMFFFTGWNTTSLMFYIPKLSSMIHHQFEQKKQEENNSLTKSRKSDRFVKYDFIKTLRLNLFINLKTVWNIIAAMLPFIISFIIDQNDKVILKYCKMIMTYIRNGL